MKMRFDEVIDNFIGIMLVIFMTSIAAFSIVALYKFIKYYP